MKSKHWIALVFVIGALLGGYWFWTQYWVEGYRPKAYVGINKYNEETVAHIGKPDQEESFILEVDALSGKITDTISMTDQFRVLHMLVGDQRNGLLYVTGERKNQKESDPETFEIYDLKSFQHVRTVEPFGGQVSRFRITPNGKKIFMKNPFYESETKQWSDPEKNKKSWILDVKTGDFINGFDISFGGSYMDDTGEYIYYFPGAKDLDYGAGIRVYSIKQDKWIKSFAQNTVRLMKEHGGFFANQIVGDTLPYPRMEFPEIDGREVVRFYDRRTYDKLGEVPIHEISEGKELAKEFPTIPDITKDNRFLVSSWTTKKRGTPPDNDSIPNQHYVRFIDTENYKVQATVKVWEGIGGQTNVVPY